MVVESNKRKRMGKGKKSFTDEHPIIIDITKTYNKNDEKDSEIFETAQEPEVEEVSSLDNILLNEDNLSSSMTARRLFAYLIAPMDVETFYSQYFEKKPLVIHRHTPNYYHNFFSKNEMSTIFKQHTLSYGQDVDVTKYIHGERTTLNPEGKATLKQIDEYLQDGASIRLLAPQQFSDPLWQILSVLEEEWGCMAGANTYYTPKGTQGFAPHFDDIEAFLVQVQGRKHWKVYAPLDPESTLPRTSSRNFKQEEMKTPIFEGVLEEGDLMYFPRGYIHQGKCDDEVDSLHVTVSTGQKNAWIDFFELLIPEAMNAACQKHTELRSSLPRQYQQHTGAVYSDVEGDSTRDQFLSSAKTRLKMVLTEALAMLDGAADQMACKTLLDRLPPMLTDAEEGCSVAGSPTPKFTVNSMVRLLRADVARMTIEDGKAIFYHIVDNSRRHFETPLQPLEFEVDDAPSIELILTSYPEYVRIGDLPLEDDVDKIELVKALYAEGCLMFEAAE